MAAAGKQGERALATATVGMVGGIVLAVVVMMVVPLPTWLLDLLITLNLGASVLLLLSAAYARDALSLASFPTVLLIATLFRLGLNVSTVRLILLHADAGRVVQTFGGFVVRGDYLVGFAVFLILTIVQYVVIARGAERVAEVAARFTLDAMPGKQLAIDADLRAAAIDALEARRRRQALSREAQLYGALDGAMRFVKGDAVAAILILAISLVGGLTVGVLRRGMSLPDAAQLYTLLTIGDGLASQIPALLISTAAARVVTRVASEDEDAVVGADIARQFFSRPRVLLGVAGLLGGIALVPGLPVVPFSLVALVFAGGAIVAMRAGAGPHATAPDQLDPTPSPDVELHVSPSLAGLPRLDQLVAQAVRDVVDDLGLPIAGTVTATNAALGANGYALRLRGALVASGAIATGEGAAGIAAALARTLRLHAAELLGLDETQRLLDRLSARAPALVRDVLPRKVDLSTLTQVLRGLLAEGLPIGELRDVLEAIATLREVERDPHRLVEQVRAGLRRRITALYAPGSRLDAISLDPLVEEALQQSLRPSRGGGRGSLALEPELAGELVASLDGALARLAPACRPVILTSPELRPHVRTLIAQSHPELAVLSFLELLPEVEVETVGRIGT